MSNLLDRLALVAPGCNDLSFACCLTEEQYLKIAERGRSLTDTALLLEHRAICCVHSKIEPTPLGADECAKLLVETMCDKDHIAYVIAADEALKVALAWGGYVLPKHILSSLLVLSLGLSSWSVSCAGDELAEDAFKAICVSASELDGWIGSVSDAMRAALKPVTNLFGMTRLTELLDRCCLSAKSTDSVALLATATPPGWWSDPAIASLLAAVGVSNVPSNGEAANV